MTAWHDIPQNEPEWFALRSGRVGGSDIGRVMANLGKAFGPPAHELAVKIALEQITGQPIISDWSNTHTQRGHDQEPIARRLYEAEFFTDVQPGGYYTLDDIEGVSPDGLVGENGLIEIKSVIYSVQFDTIKRGEYDPKYKWQLFYQLKVSGREWVDYVSYCSTFPPGRQLFVQKIYADDLKESFGAFHAIQERVAEFRELVEQKKEVILRG